MMRMLDLEVSLVDLVHRPTINSESVRPVQLAKHTATHHIASWWAAGIELEIDSQ